MDYAKYCAVTFPSERSMFLSSAVKRVNADFIVDAGVKGR